MYRDDELYSLNIRQEFYASLRVLMEGFYKDNEELVGLSLNMLKESIRRKLEETRSIKSKKCSIMS